MKTEATLGSLPMVVFTPVVGAIVGTAWATAEPTREVVRHGVLVAEGSFLNALLFAAVGAALGIALVISAISLWFVTSYWVRGDPAWEARLEFLDKTKNGIHASGSSAIRRTVSDPPSDVATLGDVEVVLRQPSGRFSHMPRRGMNGDQSAIGFAPMGLGTHFPRGEYEIRWYGTFPSRRRYEITRAKYLWAPEGDVPS
jgi:hypothetical protein